MGTVLRCERVGIVAKDNNGEYVLIFGEQIGLLEKEGRENYDIFRFEGSYGYLIGSYVRGKDGVDVAYMICKMFSYYKT